MSRLISVNFDARLICLPSCIFLIQLARGQVIGVSVEVNCQYSPIRGYTRSWYTGMRYLKQCLRAPSHTLSPQVLTRFFALFFRSVFSSILDPGTGYQKTGRLGDKIELSLVVRTFHSFYREEKGELLLIKHSHRYQYREYRYIKDCYIGVRSDQDILL